MRRRRCTSRCRWRQRRPVMDDRGIRADLGALTALNALALVDVSDVVMVKGDRAALADVLTAMRQAAAAGGGDFIAGSRAFVAGDVDDLDHVVVVLVAAHGDLHALAENGALLEDAAAHGGFLAGGDDLGNIKDILQQCAVPGVAGDLTQHLVLEVLYLRIEFSHGILTLSC